MEKAEFEKAARAVVLESNAARMELAQAQSDQFLNNATQFDPASLQRMGDEGLTAFINAIRRNGIDAPVLPARAAPPQAGQLKNTSTITPKGWSHLRQHEPNWELIALIGGTLMGLTLLVLTSVFFSIYSYYG